LQGQTVGAVRAILFAAGYNRRRLMRAMMRLGLKPALAPAFAGLVRGHTVASDSNTRAAREFFRADY